MCSIRSLSQLSSPSARLARAAPSRNKILTRKDRSHGSHGSSRAMVAGTATENRPDQKPWLKDGSSSQLSSQGTSWQNNFRESRSPQGEGKNEALPTFTTRRPGERRDPSVSAIALIAGAVSYRLHDGGRDLLQQ